MKVTIRYYGVVYDATGKRTEEIEVTNGSTISDLLANLVETRNPQLKEMIFDKENVIRDYLAFVINNVDVRSLDGFDTVLENGDIVLILPPIGGG